ncbi:hypothetical protein [Aquitalea aquatica]|uniref:Uncharacterized protein n=1 Tax=Aquitalea aquatica TaxID=3044273 RepID=A0A838YAI1_9NEIS|nr:hypothetical protein [Aquitalea magnusonii]MBA4707784.1 hypothetical protein [Aquitalea magnusonii]
MSLESRITVLAQSIAADIKVLKAAQGNLDALNTTAKASLVAAINEVLQLAQAAGSSSGAAINDASVSAGSTFSSSKITTLMADLKNQILGGASSAYDTLLEIEAKLGSDDTALANLLIAVGNRLSFTDAQSLTAAQQLQACTNLGIGDPTTDFLAAYTAAKS